MTIDQEVGRCASTGAALPASGPSPSVSALRAAPANADDAPKLTEAWFAVAEVREGTKVIRKALTPVEAYEAGKRAASADPTLATGFSEDDLVDLARFAAAVAHQRAGHRFANVDVDGIAAAVVAAVLTFQQDRDAVRALLNAGAGGSN